MAMKEVSTVNTRITAALVSFLNQMWVIQQALRFSAHCCFLTGKGWEDKLFLHVATAAVSTFSSLSWFSVYNFQIKCL